MATNTKRGTTKMSDTKSNDSPKANTASARSPNTHRGAEGEGGQITHLNRGIVEAWLDTISKDEAQKVADYANNITKGQRVGSELT